MFSVRATKKLLDRMRVEPIVQPEAPTTVLGDCARTANRRVLGSMNDFAFAMTFNRGDESLMDVALSLAQTPCSPLYESGLTFPDTATKAAFKASLH